MSTLELWWSAERERAVLWCRERSGIPRALLLVWLAAILVYLWQDPPQRGLFDWPNLFSGINLGIHELGHVLLTPFGKFLGILGGSLVQCLAPIAGMVSLYRQSDYFGVAVCGGWLSTNLFGVGTYMADAVKRELPLVSPFSGHPIHDWNFLFGRLGWLDACEELGFLTKVAGTLVMGASLGLGSWLVWRMLRQGA